MSQPTLPDGPPVPMMVEGLLDPPTLSALFADLQAATTGVSVREKGDPKGYAGTDELPLSVALARLLTGVSRAVQVRYRYDGHDWTDTVVALPTGFRVVRCRHDG